MREKVNNSTANVNTTWTFYYFLTFPNEIYQLTTRLMAKIETTGPK